MKRPLNTYVATFARYIKWGDIRHAYDFLYMFGDFRHAAKFAIELHMGEVRLNREAWAMHFSTQAQRS